MISLWRSRGRLPDPLRTARLRLVPITPAMLDAEEAGATCLLDALQAEIPPDWPPEHWEPHVRRFIRAQGTEHPGTEGYHRYIVLRDRSQRLGRQRILVGCLGAFLRTAGDVELGYSVVDSRQRQGIASEAAVALVDWLLQQPAVASVSAQTFETQTASLKVMHRCGMAFAGLGDDTGTVRYRRFRNRL